MFFWLSKVLWVVLAPSNLLLLMLLAGLLGLWFGLRRTGLVLTLTSISVSLAVAVLPTSYLLRPLEDRFPQVATLPERVDGIIVLGGSVSLGLTESRGQIQIGGHAERLTEFVTLARRYPEARLIFTGGSGSLTLTPLREADVAKQLFEDLGLDIRRLEFERESRNTYDNAAYTFAMVQPRQGEKWLLITSAFHMPRAVGSFRQVGWKVTPYPAGYHTITAADEVFRPSFGLLGGLATLDLAAHEWLGLAAYRLTGRSSDWFPAPIPGVASTATP